MIASADNYSKFLRYVETSPDFQRQLARFQHLDTIHDVWEKDIERHAWKISERVLEKFCNDKRVRESELRDSLTDRATARYMAVLRKIMRIERGETDHPKFWMIEDYWPYLRKAVRSGIAGAMGEHIDRRENRPAMESIGGIDGITDHRRPWAGGSEAADRLDLMLALDELESCLDAERDDVRAVVGHLRDLGYRPSNRELADLMGVHRKRIERIFARLAEIVSTIK